MSAKQEAIAIDADFLSQLDELSTTTIGAPVANGTSFQNNHIHVVKCWTPAYERHFAVFVYNLQEEEGGEWSYQLFVGNRGENIESDVDTKEDSFVPSEENCAKYLDAWKEEYNLLKGKNHPRRKGSEWFLALDEKLMLSTNCEVVQSYPMD